ncbi:MAG: M14 family metallopeptidase [Acidobacteriota bacterium]|nr:M14 family metallopeptidase [Acidobacteriota bacterium]
MRKTTVTPRSFAIALTLAAVLISFLPLVAGAQDSITPPDEFFGHQLGADRILARWDRMVEYFELLEEESDRIEVSNLGPSTEGHPFLLVTISSPENIANLNRIAEISRTLADPRGVQEAQIEAMISEGKAVVSQSLGLHSTEVAGCQSGPEIAYDFVARNDEEALRILDETVLLLLPCINPDGQIWVTDWYRQWVGTEYEGAGLPWLYHTYSGHDNNRDGDFLNLVESTYIAKVLYREWTPQAYVDHHQMGGGGARMYVPPYSDPIRPYADPLMWRELSWYGAHIAYKLEEAGKAGIINAAQYPGWGHFGWHWITPFHNIAGMLTESASAQLATPVYVDPDQLSGGARQLPEYEAQSTMPNPWPGGWWRVRDIVEMQKIAAWALQDMAARNRETVLRNQYLKATRQTERGATDSTNAFVIPSTQHDPLTTVKMINTLMLSDVEIQIAESRFEAGNRLYDEGSFVVSLAQPKMGLIRNLLGQTFYPDNEWTRARDGSPLRPYDTSTHTMAEIMGVQVDPVGGAVTGDLRVLEAPIPVAGTVEESTYHVLDGQLNDSFRAVNLLLEQGGNVQRVTQTSGDLRPGDFIVGASPTVVSEVARQTGVDFVATDSPSTEILNEVSTSRIGMYQRYGGGNMEEGWTRLVFEQFDFPYSSVMDAEIQAGDLNASYDVLVFPDDSWAAITGLPGTDGGRRGGGRGGNTPPDYRSGIGTEGIQAIRDFVENGGTVVAMGGATDFAIRALDLGVRNALTGLDSMEFFCPGSTLHVDVDPTNPLAWGMPKDALALFWGSPAFEITASDAYNYDRVVTYAERNILQSGWLVGEKHLSKRAAVITARVGEGKVALLGIRAQHRAQTHGTYKLLFNALIN